MKTVIHVVLFAIVACLSYFIYSSIMEPIEFNRERDARYAKGIERLKNIRTAQNAYKVEYGTYTGDFDSLINFINTGKMRVIRMEVDDSDTNDLSKTIAKDTIFISIKDSLFKNVNIDSLRFVPYTNGTKLIEMAADMLETGSTVIIPVFEAKMNNVDLLKGLDPQLLTNFNYYREEIVGFAGLKVGSISEANNNAGNWE